MELREQLQSTLGDTYTIERELAGGGMSRVYVAQERPLDRKVVIKVLPPELAVGVSIERFKREIATAAKLQHPHIVPVFNAGEVAGLPYFTMPLVEGESLRTKLTHGELPVSEVVAILRDVAQGLAFAHEHGVVHRDIKPDNVLLTRHAASVTDFGVAKAISASSNPGGGLTDGGVALGTPGYMSPEQATGDSQTDHRTDIYALGAVAYEMLTGHAPFAGRPLQQIMAAHVTEKPLAVDRDRSNIPAPLAALVMQCLEKRAADRPQSAEAVLHVLDSLSTPTGGMPPTLARPPIARSRVWLVGGIAAAAAIVIAAVVFLSGREEALNPKRVVVPPFANRTGDSTLNAIGIMAADWISRGLAETDSVQAVSSSAALESSTEGKTFEGAGAIKDLGERTKAGRAVWGSFSRRGDTLQISAEILDTRTGVVITTLVPARAHVSDPGVAIDSIRGRVMGAMAGAELTRVVGSLGRPPSYAAYREYAEAIRMHYGGEPPARTIPVFRRAAELDPSFALAASHLAVVYVNAGNWRLADSVTQALKARREQLNAVERDMLDWNEAMVTGNRQLNIAAARRLAARDSSFRSFNNLAAAANGLNRSQEAVDAWGRVPDASIPPNWAPYVNSVGNALHNIGRFKDELDVYRRRRPAFPRNSPPDYQFVLFEIRALAGLGQLDALRQVVDSFVTSWTGGQPGSPADVFEMAITELRAHQSRAAADAMLQRAVEWLRNKPGAARGTRPADRVSVANLFEIAGQLDSARAAIAALGADTATTAVRAAMAQIIAREGNAAAIEQLIAHAREEAQRPYAFGGPTRRIARILAITGRKEEALRALLQAETEGAAFTLTLHREPSFESLRDYAPFKEYIRPKN